MFTIYMYYMRIGIQTHTHTYTYIYSSCKTLIGVREMHGRMHPNYM